MKRVLFAILILALIAPDISFGQGDNRNITYVFLGQLAAYKKDTIPPPASLGFSVGPSVPDSMGSRLGIIVDTNAAKIHAALSGTTVAKGFIAFDNSLSTYVYFDGTQFIPLWGFGRTPSGGIIVPLVRNPTSANNSLVTMSDGGVIISNNTAGGSGLTVDKSSSGVPFRVKSNGIPKVRISSTGFIQADTSMIIGDTSAAPGYSLTITSRGNGLGMHRVTDQTVNTEVGRMYWNDIYWTLSTNKSGTGTAQPIAIATNGVRRAIFGADGVSDFSGSTKIIAPQFQLSDLQIAPSSATATGTKGEIRITTGFVYVCIATDTWVRAALSTW